MALLTRDGLLAAPADASTPEERAEHTAAGRRRLESAFTSSPVARLAERCRRAFGDVQAADPSGALPRQLRNAPLGVAARAARTLNMKRAARSKRTTWTVRNRAPRAHTPRGRTASHRRSTTAGRDDGDDGPGEPDGLTRTAVLQLHPRLRWVIGDLVSVAAGLALAAATVWVAS